jgi:hypothetical protein
VAVQWLRALASSRAIDFTDRDFARGQPQARAAATVSRCLHLHAEHGPLLELFRVALLVSPTGSDDDGAFGPGEVTGWVAAAVARGARDVEVDLTRGQEDPADNDGHGTQRSWSSSPATCSCPGTRWSGSLWRPVRPPRCPARRGRVRGPPLTLPPRCRRHRQGGSGHGLQLRGAGAPQPDDDGPTRTKSTCKGR